MLNLPDECKDIVIKPRHKVALEHRFVGNDVWVVLLTKMPGQRSKAWKLTKGEYWRLQPKHGTRDRFIRENYPPIMEGPPNPVQRSIPFIF